MSVYIEARLLLLPSEVGGRIAAVSPRDGSYRPFVRSAHFVSRARVFEGPPQLRPGDEALVVLEIEEAIESEVFLASERYGTRASTVIVVSETEIVFAEQSFMRGGLPQNGKREFRFAR